jgi:hypothetical protein
MHMSIHSEGQKGSSSGHSPSAAKRCSRFTSDVGTILQHVKMEEEEEERFYSPFGRNGA